MVSRQRLHQMRFPERRQAHQAVDYAVNAGQLPPARDLYCVFCGTRAAEYHHHSGYARELKLAVFPVCLACHKEHPKLGRSYSKRRQTKCPKVSSTPLVEALSAHQDELELNDENFAFELGIGAGTWRHVRTLQRPPSAYLTRKALLRFPDLPTPAPEAPLPKKATVSEAVKGTMIEYLIRKQGELSLNIEQFADKLGISRATWAKTRIGQYPIGRKLIAGAQAQFPELFTEQITQKGGQP